ncbi:MAG: DUF4294 domain-containing protein [Chitinophagaceae bacterium]|nr:DUF4294 domain-containing protein [Chitinophagaceae bacterium]
MLLKRIKYYIFILAFATGATSATAQEQPSLPDKEKQVKIIHPEYGKNDTVFVKAVVIDGEPVGGKDLQEIFIWGGDPKQAAKYWAEWTRLRNAVYVTYPYARTAGVVMADVMKHLETIEGKRERKKYIQSREKDLRAAFTDKVTDLSVYQGKVLMKLINRQTGSDCYEIIKEMKGGFTARFYQTLMFFVGSDLKQEWNPSENKIDRRIEGIVQELDRMYYGYPYSSNSNSK